MTYLRADERMAKRAELFNTLTCLDRELRLVFGRPPSNRVTAYARGLLNQRAHTCREMSKVGYQHWDIPVDMDESKVSSG